MKHRKHVVFFFKIWLLYLKLFMLIVSVTDKHSMSKMSNSLATKKTKTCKNNTGTKTFLC